jgi:hypothetical protein
VSTTATFDEPSAATKREAPSGETARPVGKPTESDGSASEPAATDRSMCGFKFRIVTWLPEMTVMFVVVVRARTPDSNRTSLCASMLDT